MKVISYYPFNNFKQNFFSRLHGSATPMNFVGGFPTCPYFFFLKKKQIYLFSIFSFFFLIYRENFLSYGKFFRVIFVFFLTLEWTLTIFYNLWRTLTKWIVWERRDINNKVVV
jgi:hypothetical protein